MSTRKDPETAANEFIAQSLINLRHLLIFSPSSPFASILAGKTLYPMYVARIKAPSYILQLWHLTKAGYKYGLSPPPTHHTDEYTHRVFRKRDLPWLSRFLVELRIRMGLYLRTFLYDRSGEFHEYGE